MTSANRYDNVQHSFQKNHGIELIRQLSLEKGMRVLDIGCGTGQLTAAIADLVGEEGRVVGVDPDQERIDLARQKYKVCHNIEFFKGSDSDFPAGPYDVIYSNFVLHWIKDKEVTFRKVYENLKVGGLFAFVVPEKAEHTPWEEIFPQMYDKVHSCKSEVYENLSQKFGFKVELKSVNSVSRDFESMDDLIEFIEASFKMKASETKKKVVIEPRITCIRIMFVLKKCG